MFRQTPCLLPAPTSRGPRPDSNIQVNIPQGPLEVSTSHKTQHDMNIKTNLRQLLMIYVHVVYRELWF